MHSRTAPALAVCLLLLAGSALVLGGTIPLGSDASAQQIPDATHEAGAGIDSAGLVPAAVHESDRTNSSDGGWLDSDGHTHQQDGYGESADRAVDRERIVPLVTGDRLRVVDADTSDPDDAVDGNGSDNAVDGNSPYEAVDGGTIELVETPGTTYALPPDRDSVLDRSLFDLDALRAAIDWGPAGTARTLPVIITTGADPETVDGPGIENPRALDSTNGVAAELSLDAPETAIERLRERAIVDRIALDRRIDTGPTAIEPPSPGDDHTATDHPSADSETPTNRHDPTPRELEGAVSPLSVADSTADASDLQQSNVTVAVLDTGIDPEHPDLDGQIVDRVDLVGDDREGDPSGHGTAVAGILAGTGEADDRGYEGVAPGVDIVDVRALNAAGSGQTSTLIEGIEYAVEDAEADVIVMSTGGSFDQQGDLETSIDWASDQGAVVVTSSGNVGEPRSIDATGRADSAITVGAYDHETGGVAPFSSRGPTLDGRLKPDVVARGTAVPAPGSSQADGRTYRRMWGTSAAAPAVAGVAARLLAANPDLDPAAVKARIVTTAQALDGPTVYEQGGGRVDADRALDPDVLVDPPRASIGAGDDDRELVLTVENRDNRAHELVFDPQIRTVDGGDRGENPTDDTLQLNRSTVTVGPDSTERVGLRVDALPAGTYSASLRYEVNGTPRSVPIAIVDGGEVTVEKRRLDGSLDEEGEVLVFAEDGSHEEIVPLTDGTGSFFASGGSYTMWTTRTDKRESTTVLVSERREFDGPESVVLDERDTVPVGPRPGGITSRFGELLTLSKTASMTGSAGEHRVSWDVSTDRSEAPRVRASPDPDLSLAVAALLVPAHDGERAPLDTPDVFHLAWGTDGVQGHRRYVTPLSLDTTVVEYHRDRTDEELTVEYFADPDGARLHRQRGGLELGGRTEQRVHRLVPGADYGVRVEGDGRSTVSQVHVGGPRMHTSELAPRRTISRLKHPFHADLALAQAGDLRPSTSDGTPPFETVDDEAPWLAATPMTGSAQGAIVSSNASAQLTVESGSERLSRTTDGGRIGTDLSSAVKPGDGVRVRLSATAPNATLSTRTVSELFVSEYDPETPPPLSITDIDIPEADATGAVTAKSVELHVTGEGFERVFHDRLWYAIGSPEQPPWVDETGWHQLSTDRERSAVTGSIPLGDHDLPTMTPPDRRAADDTPFDDRPETISVAAELGTDRGDRYRTMTTDAVHVGSAPDDSTVHLGGRVASGTEHGRASTTDTDQPLVTAGDTVMAIDTDERIIHAIERIEADGTVAMELPADQSYDLVYRAGPLDEPLTPRPSADRPTVHPLDRVNATEDEWLGTCELPESSPLAVSVRDQRGHPVENATVRLRVASDGAAGPVITATTDANGTARRAGGNATIAIAGSAELTVVPPDSDPDLDTTVREQVTIDEPTTATVELPVVDPQPSLSVSNTTVERGTKLELSAADSETVPGNATYRWDLTGNGEIDRRTETPTLTLVSTSVGDRTISVTVVDELGNEATASESVTVRPNADGTNDTTTGDRISGAPTAEAGTADERSPPDRSDQRGVVRLV